MALQATEKIKKKNNAELMDPKIDFTFKELFGHNPAHFINLANAILDLDDDKKIKNIPFLNGEMSKDKKDDRGSRLDVLAKLNDDSFLNLLLLMLIIERLV